jgi:cell division protein FtsL
MTVMVRKEWLRGGAATADRIDRARARARIHWPTLARWGGLLGLLFAAAFFCIWQKFMIVRGGYEIESLKRRLSDLQSQNSMLTVEAASLEDFGGMERRAVEELGMVRPAPGQIVPVRNVASVGERHEAAGIQEQAN